MLACACALCMATSHLLWAKDWLYGNRKIVAPQAWQKIIWIFWNQNMTCIEHTHAM